MYPEKYFYSQYLGEGFLQSWYENRKQYLRSDSILNLEGMARQCIFLLKGNVAETDLCKCLSKILHRPGSEKFCLELADWVRKFEIKKNLFGSWMDNEAAIKNYCTLNVYFLIGYKKYLDISALNASLKLNDLLVSIEDEMDDDERNLLSSLIHYEISFIHEIQHVLSK